MTKNIDETAAFCKDIGTYEVNILPFHRLGDSKYERLDMDYKAKDMVPPSDELMEHIASRIRKAGLECYIGSNTPFCPQARRPDANPLHQAFNLPHTVFAFANLTTHSSGQLIRGPLS